MSLLNRSITTLGEIAEGEAHDPVRIGAMRLLAETLGARISLLIASGSMPRRLAQQRDHDNAVTIIRRMAEAPMDVEVGQKVYVPDPHGNPVLGTVQALGEKKDAVEVDVEGKAVPRDVVFVRHDAGEQEGFVAKVPYHEIFPDEKSFHRTYRHLV